MKAYIKFIPHKEGVSAFAVSKEISVGDQVFYFYDNPDKHPFKYPADNEKVKYNKNPIGKMNVYVKILGEVSPDAVWVKDGDEVEVEWKDLSRTMNLMLKTFRTSLI